MSTFALIRNGMGDPNLGTGAEEDDILHFPNWYLYQSGRIDAGDYAVSQRAAGANMSVDVAKGRAFIDNTDYTVNTNSSTRFWPVMTDAIVNVPISANASGNPRIDLIVITLNEVTAPDDNASNVVSVTVVEGTPAASPVAPTPPDNSYILAQVAVASGATSIVDANITDERDYAHFNLNKGVVPYGDGLNFIGSTGAINAQFFYASATNLALRLRTASDTFSVFDQSDIPIVSMGAAGRVFDLNYGTILDIFGAANSAYGRIRYTDGSGMIYSVSADNHYFNDSGGNTVFGVGTGTASVYQGYIFQCYSAGNDKILQVNHDDTNARYTATVGGHVFKTGSTDIAGFYTTGVFVYDGIQLIVESAGNDKGIAIYHNDTNGVFSTSSGAIVFLPASGIFSIETSGVTNQLRIYDSGLTKYFNVKHDGSNVLYDVSSGSHVFRDSGATNRFVINGGTITVTADVIPSADFTYDIGSSSYKYQDGWFNNELHAGYVYTTMVSGSSGGGNIDCYGEFRPLTDNTYKCGTAARRWSDVRSVLINGADIGFQNDWKFREYPITQEEVQTKSVEWMREHANAGIQLLDDDEKVIAIFGKNGVLYVDDVRPLALAVEELGIAV